MLDGDVTSIHLLSTLSLAPAATREQALRYLGEIDDRGVDSLIEIASAHHVVLRAFSRGYAGTVPPWSAGAVQRTIERGEHAARKLHEVCSTLESKGCPVVVIKSFDHWPDLGSDLDLLTCSDESQVVKIMTECFAARVASRTWSDRTAHKLNFRLPSLPELVEIHFGRLGQTGEQLMLSERILSRRSIRQFANRPFPVPAPEDRVLLSTLQRLYRHFFIRICDFADTVELLDSGELDFDELRHAAKQAAIWPGVATFLRLVAEYGGHYRGQPISLPRRVEAAARFGIDKMYPNTGFLRLPLFPQAAGLYCRQLMETMRHRDPAASLRLGLVPPLALAASMRYKLTGNTQGIW